jgi:hypothetical protein
MTGHETIEPDPFVQTALQLLPIPPHRDRFWEDLGAALDAASTSRRRQLRAGEPSSDALATAAAQDVALAPSRSVFADVAAPAGGPSRVHELVEDHSLAVVPPALRRRSNAVLSAVAVAAAVMVVIAGTTLVRQRSGGGTADVGDAALASTTTSVDSLSAPGAGDASAAAVLAWVGALGGGDTDAAWAAMGPASQAHFGSRSAFAHEASSLAEGYGAWSGVTPDAVYVMALASGGGTTAVVTLVGVLEQEGSRQHRADAFGVRVVDGRALVEPFAFAGEIEIIVPAPSNDGVPPILAADDELVVVVPRGIGAPTIRIDDGEALVCGEADGTELTELDGAPGQRCSYDPPGGIEAGERVLTVGFVSADGSGIAAASVLFEAA